MCLDRTINVSTIITILIFILGYVINKYFEKKSKLSNRKDYLVALLQEINLNIDTLKKAEQELPSVKDLDDFLEKDLPGRVNRPIMTLSYSSFIFKSKIDIIHGLDDIVIKSITQFYGKLDSIAVDIGTIEYKAYETISPEGRSSIFAAIRIDLHACLVHGEAARDGIALYLRLKSKVKSALLS